MAYKSVVLEDSVTINRIISVHYFQYMSDFSFPGESHDFWELVCVDRGEIDALAGDRRLTLKKGNILFHKPNEFHNVLTNGKAGNKLLCSHVLHIGTTNRLGTTECKQGIFAPIRLGSS